MPNFIIIGAPKAGTTSLYALLRQHPDVFMCEPKEPAYFLYDKRYQQQRAWYESLFIKADSAKAVGEATTEYSRTLSYPKVLPRIARDIKNVRLIYMVRHPQDILVSRWRQELFNDNKVSRNFSKALRQSPQLLENARFGHCLKTIYQHFPPERLLVVFYDEWLQWPAGVMQAVASFLEIENIWLKDIVVPRLNAGDLKDMDGIAMRIMRRLPFADAVRRNMPAEWRHQLRRRLRRAVPPTQRWRAEDVAFVRDQLSDELAWFLRQTGRSPNHWILDTTR